MRTYLLLALLLGLVESLPAGARSPGQATNLSGEWAFSVNMARYSFEETFVLTQEGEKLTGTYKGGFGEKTITGTVKGNQVVVVVEVVRERRNVKATYTGTIESASQMIGRLQYVDDPDDPRGWWTAVPAAVAAARRQAVTSATPPARKAGDVVIEPASMTSPETGAINYELGTLYVPENRADPKSRLIGIGFARIRALQPTGAPPTFHLPGGPGQSFLPLLRQGRARFWLRTIALYRRVSDVVIVDQRGFSERGEILKFKYRTKERPLDQPESLARAVSAEVEMARAAIAEYANKGIDLRGYTIQECADDVNDLRKALGYDRITLVGTSFGSQWSFAVMRLHPDIVARALLSGVEPLDYSYDMPSHVFAAMQRMWWEAEKDLRLKPYLPPGGIAAAARAVLQRLERAPVEVKVKGNKTGEMVKIILGREDFQRSLEGFQGSFPLGTRGPAFILALYYEQYEAWARSVLASRRSREAEITLIGPLIDTSLGVTAKREHLLRTDAGTEFIGQWNFADYLAMADIWPTPDLGDDFRTPVISRIPVVFAQGDWDTYTPIENALNIAPYFPNGRVVITERGEHGVLDSLAADLPEVMATLLEFLQTGNIANLPARVTLPAPRFFAPDFPPPSAKPNSSGN
jgi:pimeloyl-ACP methyl ester carboxylesterase